MTRIYFVRHAQPDVACEDDRNRTLTEEGRADTKAVLEVLKDKAIDVFYCSPYRRSMDTIAETAQYFGKSVIVDDRLREREVGINGSKPAMIKKRWADFDYHEEEGESIGKVQERNVAALNEILKEHENKNIVIGTHGTALGSILNYYNPDFSCDDFFRIMNWMPYIIELDFEGKILISLLEHMHVAK